MAHRYRMYPTDADVPMMVEHCAHRRFMWNLALEQFNMYRAAWGRTPNDAERCRQLTELRGALPWLAAGCSKAQQQALRDFDRACQDWWSGRQGRPLWRKQGIHESFRIAAVKVQVLNRKWATVNVPKVGYVKFRLSRPLPEKYGMADVTCDRAGRWYVSFRAGQPVFEREQTGAAVGIDLGVAHGVTTSDGCHTSPAGLTAGEKARLLRLQRKLARQQKGSGRYETTRLAIAKLKAREVDRRKDWVEKESTGIVRENDVVVFEALKIGNMTRSARGTIDNHGTNVAAKAGLNCAVLAVGWGDLRRRVKDKAGAATSPVQVVEVNPAFTSQRCATCAHTSKENRESQAVFRCTQCGHTANADVNAAINILAAGLAVHGRGDPPGVCEASTINAA